MALRDHKPVNISKFNGLWDQGDIDSTPQDHFSDCGNINYFGFNSFKTRPGIGISQDVDSPLQNIKRIYNYPQPTQNTLLILTYTAGVGEIYHFVNSTTIFGPVLSITGMTDFTFAPYGGRAYISPFTTFAAGEINIEKGLQNEFLYVYLGDGTLARKAAGTTPSGTLTIANGAAGFTDAGLKVFGVVGETDSGFLSAPCALASFSTSATQSVSFGTVPTFTGAQWVKRHIVASISIPSFNGNLEQYQLFFIPDAVINNNTDNFINDISFYDADLLEDASNLFDILGEIPAGCHLTLYHGRFVLTTTFDDINSAIVSLNGQPEAFSTIDGFLGVTPDGNPITNGQEMRDIFYLTKRNRTIAYTDNGDEPDTWEPTVIDLALGSCVHGIATVLDSGSTSVDFLIISTYRGICLFNGKYILPELTWKVYNRWLNLDRNKFGNIQLINDPINTILYCILPDGTILTGNYSNGLDPMKIRWAPWTFIMPVNTVAIYNINEVIIGADLIS